MCQDLEKTPEGRCELAANNCLNGFYGQPKNFPLYSSNSNSCWKGISCKKEKEPEEKCDTTCSVI